MRKRIWLYFSIIVFCLSTTPSMADFYGTADVVYNTMAKKLALDTVMYLEPGGVSVYAGLNVLTISNLNLTGSPPLPSESPLRQGSQLAFCIDLYDIKPPVSTAYDVVSLDTAPDAISEPGGAGMGADKAAYIAELLDTHAYGTKLEAAAMQIAIWEIIDEDYGDPGLDGIPGPSGWNVSSGQGNFYLDTSQTMESAVAALANSWLSALPATTPATSFSAYTALSNDAGYKGDQQDFVVVPAPAAFLLGMIGIGAAGLKLRQYA